MTDAMYATYCVRIIVLWTVGGPRSKHQGALTVSRGGEGDVQLSTVTDGRPCVILSYYYLLARATSGSVVNVEKQPKSTFAAPLALAASL